MIRLRAILALTSVLGLVVAGLALEPPPAESQPTTQGKPKTAYFLIQVKGVIGEDFTAAHMQSLLYQAEKRMLTVVVLEIDTPGGAVSEAEKIVDLLIAHKNMRFVALVRKALSAGATITLACKEIYMTESATIGAAVSYLRGKDGRPEFLPRDVAEKMQSAWRAVCRKAADHGEHPSVLAEAMVDPDFALTVQREKDGRITLQRVQRGAPAQGEILKEFGRILTLTAKEAVACGLAKGVAPDAPSLGPTLGFASWTALGALPSAIEGVEIGMSIEEVEKVLGRPKDITMTRQGDKTITIQTYVKGEREMVVMFDDGKVMTTHQGATGGGDEPTKDSPLLGAKFSKVKTGMSADEVLKLLGTPANQTGQGNMMTYHWRDAKAEYVVLFVNNKVQTMHRANRSDDE